MTLVYLDVETTGVDPLDNQILTIGYVVEEDGQIISERLLNVKYMGGAFQRRALEVNGIDLEDHNQNALHPTDALLELTKDLQPYRSKRIVAHNAAFDKAFIDVAFRKWAVYDEAYIVRSNWLCTMQLALWMIQEGHLKTDRNSAGLDNVLRALGFPDRGSDAHGALKDALLAREAHHRIQSLAGWT